MPEPQLYIDESCLDQLNNLTPSCVSPDDIHTEYYIDNSYNTILICRDTFIYLYDTDDKEFTDEWDYDVPDISDEICGEIMHDNIFTLDNINPTRIIDNGIVLPNCQEISMTPDDYTKYKDYVIEHFPDLKKIALCASYEDVQVYNYTEYNNYAAYKLDSS